MAYDLPLIWQDTAWPQLRFDIDLVSDALSKARRAQGMVEGKWASIATRHRAVLEAAAWSEDALATAAIEGERYDRFSVESSIQRRLGLLEGNGPHVPRNVEGLLDVMEDAVTRCNLPLTHERLWAWQSALFPDGWSGMRRIEVATYRTHPAPMQIVSAGPEGREKVLYEAPPSAQLPVEMEIFVQWFNRTLGKDPLVAAALAHLWFESIHPFEDGNGRVGRALIDLVLAREMGASSRLIRTSQRLLKVRAEYYDQLREARSVDVTRWVLWFLEQVRTCCEEASLLIDHTIEKFHFWVDHAALELTGRQRKVLNVLLDAGPDGFQGGMSTRKYESIGATSKATASRELLQLEQLGLLRRVGAGRSTRYYVAIAGWGPTGAETTETALH